jgi:aconitate hydratase
VPKAFAASNELEVNVAQKDHRPVDYVLNGHQYQLRTARL